MLILTYDGYFIILLGLGQFDMVFIFVLLLHADFKRFNSDQIFSLEFSFSTFLYVL